MISILNLDEPVRRILSRNRLRYIADVLHFIEPSVTMADDFEGLVIQYGSHFTRVTVCEDDENYFLVLPESGMHMVPKKELMAGTN